MNWNLFKIGLILVTADIDFLERSHPNSMEYLVGNNLIMPEKAVLGALVLCHNTQYSINIAVTKIC